MAIPSDKMVDFDKNSILNFKSPGIDPFVFYK